MNKEKEVKHFHITITNSTNDVIVDTESNCIIAGVNTEKGSSVLVMSECNTFDLIKCTMSAKEAINNTKKCIGKSFAKLLDDEHE